MSFDKHVLGDGSLSELKIADWTIIDKKIKDLAGRRLMAYCDLLLCGRKREFTATFGKDGLIVH